MNCDVNHRGVQIGKNATRGNGTGTARVCGGAPVVRRAAAGRQSRGARCRAAAGGPARGHPGGGPPLRSAPAASSTCRPHPPSPRRWPPPLRRQSRSRSAHARQPLLRPPRRCAAQCRQVPSCARRLMVRRPWRAAWRAACAPAAPRAAAQDTIQISVREIRLPKRGEDPSVH